MTSRRHGRRRGNNASEPATAPEPINTPEADPVAFALRLMQDESQPMALRAGMAKAAMGALQKRDGAAPAQEEGGKPKPKYSDLELARRVAHIMALGDAELAGKTGKPVENADLPGMLARLTAKTT